MKGMNRPLQAGGITPIAPRHAVHALLGRFANGHVFFLNGVTVCNAVSNAFFCVPIFKVFVIEVKVKNDFATVRRQRQHDVGVHAVTVAVDKKVGKKPGVHHLIAQPFVAAPRAANLYGSSSFESGFVPFKLQSLRQPLMGISHMISAIQAVIDKNFPVAVQHIFMPFAPPQLIEPQFFQRFFQRCQIFVQFARVAIATKRAIHIDKQKRSPTIHTHGTQPISRRIEANLFSQVRSLLQRPIMIVFPTMIRTHKRLTPSLFHCHGRPFVSAGVVMRIQFSIHSAHHHIRVSHNFASDVRPRLFHLFHAPRRQPTALKDVLLFQLKELLIHIPAIRRRAAVFNGTRGIKSFQ